MEAQLVEFKVRIKNKSKISILCHTVTPQKSVNPFFFLGGVQVTTFQSCGNGVAKSHQHSPFNALFYHQASPLISQVSRLPCALLLFCCARWPSSEALKVPLERPFPFCALNSHILSFGNASRSHRPNSHRGHLYGNCVEDAQKKKKRKKKCGLLSLNKMFRVCILPWRRARTASRCFVLRAVATRAHS